MIEVRIEHTELEGDKNDIHAGMRVLIHLRKAGVPVIGNIWPRGVEHGTLTVTEDVMFGQQVWEWKP